MCHLSELHTWLAWNRTNKAILKKLINEPMMTGIQSILKAPLGSVISGSLLLNLFPLFFYFTVFVFF